MNPASLGRRSGAAALPPNPLPLIMCTHRHSQGQPMPLPYRLIPILLVLSSISCSFEPEGLRVANGGKPPVLRPNYAVPIAVPHSDFLAIPFSMYVPASQKAQQFELSSGFGSYSGSFGSVSFGKSFGGFISSQSVHWNNVIFLDKKTGTSHLLLDHKAVITAAHFPDPDKPATGSHNCLLFAIAEADTNGDGYINSEDAVLLYSADLDGTHLTRLTPPNT